MSRSFASITAACVVTLGLTSACGHSKDDSDNGYADATTSNGQTDGTGNVNGNQGIGNDGSGSGSGGTPPTPQPPTALAGSVTFTDLDTGFDELEGDITFTKASDESDITHYVVYWGDSASTKLSPTPIQTVAKTGSDLSINLPADTPIPSDASHFLVISKNAAGESSNATALNITELVEVTEYITSAADDWYWQPGGPTFSSGAAALTVDAYNNHEVGIRFQNVTITNSANILTAYIRVVFKSYGTNNFTTIRGHNADSGGVCTDSSECDSLAAAATTASTVWGPLDGNVVTGIILPSFEIKNIISEITSRPGWNIGQDITLLLTNPSGTGATAIAAYDDTFQKSELFFRYTRDL